MKIGEWDSLGKARRLLQTQLGELGAAELAAHVTIDPDNGRQRILVATDIGLLDYGYAPISGDPNAPWLLRGTVYRWPSVRGLRVQTDAQLEPGSGNARSLWRLVAEEPRMELVADSSGHEGRALGPLLAFARACLAQTT